MNLLNYIIIGYLALPIVILGVGTLGFSLFSKIAPGAVVSLLRLPLLFGIGFQLFAGGFQINSDPVGIINFTQALSIILDPKTFFYLCVLDLCFFFSSWTLAGKDTLALRIKQALLLPLQFLLPIFVLTSNVILAGCISILLGLLLFFLLRLSESAGEAGFGRWASSFYRAYTFFGLSMAIWGIYVFFGGGKGEWGQAIWMVLLISCCPFPLWSRWIFPAIERMGHSLSLVVVCIHSTFLFKVAGFLSMFENPSVQFLNLIFIVGYAGCIYSLWKMSDVEELSGKLFRMKEFLFSLCLLSISLGGVGFFNSVFQISIYVPLLTVLSMYMGGRLLSGWLDKALVLALSVFYLGLPGTPLFLIFAEVGGRSLAGGRNSLLLFAVLWMAYFVSTSKMISQMAEIQSRSNRLVWPSMFPRIVLGLIGLMLILTYLAWRV